MLNYQLILAVFIGIATLLVLILKFRIQAFIALLIASIAVGISAGMDPSLVIKTMQDGMGNTLGFVAVVVGLGAMFGAILEHSGGAEALAKYLLHKFGEKNASWALMLTGFFVAIPVFFDVAFIILVPLIYSLQRKTKKSLLLLCHSFISRSCHNTCFHSSYSRTSGRSRYFKSRFGMGYFIWFCYRYSCSHN